ncbi:MAG TPA: hypothetical protein VLM36_11885 [Sphingomicrobium sp.]|nr:hypothetical protein [Sphingomicrobium sp.]
MQQAVSARAPAHLWIVGVLSLLWNCFGAYDYTMTRTHNMEYLKKAMPGIDPNAGLAWIESMPMYAQIGWGMGVWLALLGSVLLLIRSRWAVWSFGLSLVGAVLSIGYQMLLAPPMPGAGASAMMKVMPAVILIIAVALFLYARAQEKKGILR